MFRRMTKGVDFGPGPSSMVASGSFQKWTGSAETEHKDNKSTIVEFRYLSIAILTENCSGYFCTGTYLAPGHRKNVQHRLFLTARAFQASTDTVAN